MNIITELQTMYEVLSILIPLGYYYFHAYNQNVLYLNSGTVQYYLKVHCYFYTYKQLYVISFLFFDNLVIVSGTTLQAIMSPDNAPVHNRVYGYLRLSTCVSYIFNILPVIFPLYLLVTTQIQLMKLLLLHNNLPYYLES